MLYRVNEVFTSIQGEGSLMGTPSTFIRLQVCTVGCPWCDTKYTWKEGGTLMTVSDIVRQVHAEHVVITGGEPTIWNLDELISELWDMGKTTQLETSGQYALKGKLQPDYITWSPKHNLKYDAPMSIKDAADEVKFVIDDVITVSDIQNIIDYMATDMPRRFIPIVLMPEGCPPGPESIERTMKLLSGNEIDYRGLPKRLGWRLQYTLNIR